MQLNAAHTGAAREPSLEPPLRLAWQRSFDQPPGYPLIVGGRVFVAVQHRSPRRGADVIALSARTGRTLWRRDVGGYVFATAAYDAGRLYVLSDDATIFALDPASGRVLWRHDGDLVGTDGPPVGYAGNLYVVRNSYVQAFDGETGAELWSSLINGTDATGPAVAGDRVYASFAGPQVYAFDRATGAEIWHPYESTHGGGGQTPALYRDRLYVRHSRGFVFGAQDGSPLGEFRSEFFVEPAFAHGRAYVLDDLDAPRAWRDGGNLVAIGLRGLRPAWRFRGDGYLQSSPLVVNRTVYAGSATGRLYALDARTGRLRWKTHLATGISGDGFGHGDRALAAGRGLLVVPATRRLIALR
jgi:outer membrane protein assembly factor BamB